VTILVVGRFYRESFARHIAETLVTMGHQVTPFEMGIRQRTGSRAIIKRLEQVRAHLFEAAGHIPLVSRRRSSSLRRIASSPRADLTIVCHDLLLPAQVELLKAVTRSPVVLWFPDSISVFGRAMFLNAAYDALFFKDPYLVHRLRKDLGRTAYYLPESCNPRCHRPVPLSDADCATFSCDVATAGNLYTYRSAFFEHLAHYRVHIWGNPPPVWMKTEAISGMVRGRYVAEESKAKAFQYAKAVVNNLHAAEIWGINVRAFEIAAVGAFQLISWRPALNQLFEDGEELVSFDGIGDLREKLEYYLPRAADRARIAARGRERALRDHTYAQRLTLMLRTVFGDERGYPMPDVRSISPMQPVP
jgi:spore maturation protein CgeB